MQTLTKIHGMRFRAETLSDLEKLANVLSKITGEKPPSVGLLVRAAVYELLDRVDCIRWQTYAEDIDGDSAKAIAKHDTWLRTLTARARSHDMSILVDTRENADPILKRLQKELELDSEK